MGALDTMNQDKSFKEPTDLPITTELVACQPELSEAVPPQTREVTQAFALVSSFDWHSV